MYAVVGVWDMNPQLAVEQAESLGQLVTGVRKTPGLVTGYWTAAQDSSTTYTFIVFTDRTSAESFASDVRANTDSQARSGVPNISLDATQVTATT